MLFQATVCGHRKLTGRAQGDQGGCRAGHCGDAVGAAHWSPGEPTVLLGGRGPLGFSPVQTQLMPLPAPE